MTVYVDDAIHPFGRMRMCHMVSPDVEELHAMADTIGVSRRWFQNPLTMNVSRPHYDIAKVKRALAIRAGAVEIGRSQMVAISNIALSRLPGVNAATRARDPLRIFRSHDGGPGHPDLPRLEAWLRAQGYHPGAQVAE